MFRNKEKLLLLMFLALFFCISGVGAASAADVPVANFTSNVTNGAAPLSVQFNDTSTGNSTSWYWDFGDNQNSTLQNPTHTYTNAGTYNVSETVTGAGGSNTDTQNNYIAVIPTNYVTYLGGNQTDQGHSIAVDSMGNIYVTGSTTSANFPTTSNAFQKTYSGGQDVFLSEFNSSGNLIYSTYLGGNNTDYGMSVVVGNNGIIYVAGWTNSTDFPTTNGAYQTTNNGLQNAFLSEFNSTGNLIYSTYLGGTSSTYVGNIAVDNEGTVYITGNTESPDFPTTSNAYQTTYSGVTDAYLSEFNSSGNLIYSTYLGGNSKFGADTYGYGVAVDNNGNVFITGTTFSPTFPTTIGAYQTVWENGSNMAFLSEFNSSGNLVYSTYLGGDTSDYSNSVAVDGQGNVYLTGFTVSPDFPTTSNAYQKTMIGAVNNAFLTEFNSNESLIYSTYLGGTGSDWGYGLSVDSAGNIYLSGLTSSTNFPTTSGAYQTIFGNGTYDSYVTKFNSNKTLIYSTYLGGSALNYGEYDAIDDNGNVYITGYTSSNDFPTTTGAYQTNNNGTENAFIAKLNTPTILAANFTANTTNGTAPLNTQFTDNSTNSTSWLWNFGDGTTSTIQNPTHTYTEPGTYTVTEAVTGPDGNNTTTGMNIHVAPLAVFATSTTNGTAPLNVYFFDQSTGDVRYYWDFRDGATSINKYPTHTYTTPGTYTVTETVTGPGGNSNTTTKTITVNHQVTIASFIANVTNGNTPLNVQFTDTSSDNPTSWLWNFGDGTTSTLQNPTHTYTTSGTYTVTETASGAGGNNTIIENNYITVKKPPTLNGNLYVTDAGNNAVYEIHPNGTMVQLGNGYAFNTPYGIAVDSQGNVYVADLGNNAVDEIYINGTVVQLGNGYAFNSPVGIAVDSQGNVYVGDVGNSLVEEILTNGTVIQIGSGWIAPCGVAVDAQGNVVVGDYGTAVYEVYTNGTIKTMGTTSGFGQDGVAIDSQGNIYMSDNNNGGIWEFGANGSVTEIGESNEPALMALDPNGNLYITDQGDNLIQEILPNGTVQYLGSEYDFGMIAGVAYQELPPVANFTENNNNGVGPLNVQFTDQSIGDITSWLWNFGDGGNSTQQNPTYTYNTPGTYNVTLTVTNSAGNNTTTSKINVNYPTPVAGFTVNQPSGTAPESVQFTDNSNGNITGYNWNFGDGSQNSTEQNPTHTYTIGGTYNVTETVTGPGGSNITILTVNVTPDTSIPVVNATLASGIFNSNQTVNLTATDNDPNLKIYYTLNGTAPTTSSTLYTEPLTISKLGTTTLEFIAMDTAGNISNTVTRTYTIDTTIPTANANIKGGLYNTNKVVTLTMSEPGNIYYTLNGTTPTSKSTLYTKPITISSTSTLKYLEIDLASNKSSINVQNYVIDKVAPTIVKTNPKYNAIDVPLTTPLTITFSENILKGINYNDIYVKNVNTGKLVQITKILSKNTLTIKMTKSRLHNNKYIIYIPKDAFKDLAGNLTAAYTIKFKTG